MEFHVGDIVRVREWEDMAEQYGCDRRGDIHLPSLDFTDDMKSVCGMEFELRESDFNDAFNTQVFKRITINGLWFGITEYMLELVLAEELETSEELDSFLNRYKTLKAR